MFRAVRVCRAALASHKPVLAASVSSRMIVKRFVGDHTNRLPNVSAITSVISKTKGEGLAGTAALVGRAAFYVRCKNYEAAITEVDKIFPSIQEEDLKRMALGIRLRARNGLLDVKEGALTVTGGTTEMDVSTLRTALRADYAALKEASTGCWLVEMATGEYALYEGKAEEAFNVFCDVEEKIGAYIAAVGKSNVSDEVALPENTQLSALLAFQLNRIHDTEGVKHSASKLVEEGIESIVNDSATKETITAFKKELGGSLTDEEVIEMAYILEGAHVRYHFHDYFPVDDEYANWPSETASRVRKEILHFYAPESAKLPTEQFENVKKAIPPQPFYASESELQKFLSSPHKNILSELRKTFGSGPQSALSKADEAFFESMKLVDQSAVSSNAAGCHAYPKSQNELCVQLARQLLYRAKVNMAVALTQMDRNREAVELLDEVIAANEYIYMWRAYLARGEAYKHLGLITKSDKDFRQLSELKKSFTNHAQ